MEKRDQLRKLLKGASLKPQAGPLYSQLKQLIMDRIEAGDLPPDSPVPSENALSEALGISRLTAHRALRELSEEGFLVRVRGIGSFVAPRKSQANLLEIKPIAEQIKGRGGVHQARLHQLTEERATEEIARSMELAPGARVFHSIMVHLENGQPIQLADRYVNPAVAEDFLDMDFSLISPSQYLFERCRLAEAEITVESSPSDGLAQELLEVGPEESCLIVHRRTWEKGGLVSTVVRLVHPGSLYQLTGRFRPNP